MRESLLADRLQLTRQVFAGEVTRTQLMTRSVPEMAFVGVAIMLAVPRQFLDRGNVVKGHLSVALGRLLSSGVSQTQAARDMGLYRPNPGRGNGKPVQLTPPPQLTRLVRELGATPAVQVFLRDAADDVALRQEAKEAQRRQVRATIEEGRDRGRNG